MFGQVIASSAVEQMVCYQKEREKKKSLASPPFSSPPGGKHPGDWGGLYPELGGLGRDKILMRLEGFLEFVSLQDSRTIRSSF